MLRRLDLNFLGEPPSAQDAGIDVFRMIGGAHQENIVVALQAADFREELLYKLNIMLRQVAIVCRQQSIHFVEKDDCRTVFFCTCKDRGHTLNGIADTPSQNVGRSQRIKAALRLACNQSGNQCLAGTWRANQ